VRPIGRIFALLLPLSLVACAVDSIDPPQPASPPGEASEPQADPPSPVAAGATSGEGAQADTPGLPGLEEASPAIPDGEPELELPNIPVLTGPGPGPSRTCSYTKDADGFFKLLTKTGGIDYWVRLPPTYTATKSYPMLVGMHGCGDNAKNFATWALSPWNIRSTQTHIAVSVGAGRDGQCWTASTDEAKILAVVADVRQCFWAHQRKIVLAGYSSGGIAAYYTGVRNAAKFAGILIENSSLQSAFGVGTGTDNALNAAAWKINVAISARTGDEYFPIAQLRTDKSKLTAKGFPVQYRELAGGHSGTSDDWTGFLLTKYSTWRAP